MVALKKFKLDGNEAGEVNVDDQFLEIEANSQMIKDYIVALRANARQWSANTKGRSEVNHTKKKPHKQKGTGNARQGSLAAPQYKGGGVVFGPKPKFDQHVRINRKERRLAIRNLLSEKIKSEGIVVVEDAAFNTTLQAPKTKAVADLLKSKKLAGRRVLFVGENQVEKEAEASSQSIFKKSTHNIPRSAFILAECINGYDLLAARGIVMTESALSELIELLR